MPKKKAGVYRKVKVNVPAIPDLSTEETMYGGFLTKMISISVAGICVFCIAACGAVETPVSTIMPTATVSPVRTATHTSTPMPTNTPTLTPSPTTLPIMDRDLSAIVLQPSEIPEYYNNITSYMGPSCLESVYAEYEKVHENLINGYERRFLSYADASFYTSLIFVYADASSAKEAYREFVHEWPGTLIEDPGIGSESFAGLSFDLQYSMYLMKIVWRSDEAVMELLQFAFRRPNDAEMARLARAIQRRLGNPPLPTAALSSPDGGGSGKIAFISNGMVKTANIDGSEITCIADKKISSFDFSPDGKTIAFTSSTQICRYLGDNRTQCEWFSDIYTIQNIGTESMALAGPRAREPRWSPDGKKIIYLEWREIPFSKNQYSNHLMIMDADGENKQELAMPWVTSVDWSPDGEKIAYACSNGKKYDICTIKPDGSDVVDLTNDKENDNYFVQWSPDASKILFDSWREGVHNGYYVIDSEGGQRVEILRKGEMIWGGQWSPDGTKIAYVYRYFSDIYSVNTDGSVDIRLTDFPGSDDCPVWSPDGEKILFISQRNGPRELFLMNADGSDQHFVAWMGGEFDYCPVWVPG